MKETVPCCARYLKQVLAAFRQPGMLLLLIAASVRHTGNSHTVLSIKERLTFHTMYKLLSWVKLKLQHLNILGRHSNCHVCRGSPRHSAVSSGYPRHSAVSGVWEHIAKLSKTATLKFINSTLLIALIAVTLTIIKLGS